jgi:hypothetical protein
MPVQCLPTNLPTDEWLSSPHLWLDPEYAVAQNPAHSWRWLGVCPQRVYPRGARAVRWRPDHGGSTAASGSWSRVSNGHIFILPSTNRSLPNYKEGSISFIDTTLVNRNIHNTTLPHRKVNKQPISDERELEPTAIWRRELSEEPATCERGRVDARSPPSRRRRVAHLNRCFEFTTKSIL